MEVMLCASGIVSDKKMTICVRKLSFMKNKDIE